MPFVFDMRRVLVFCRLYLLPLCSVLMGVVVYVVFYLSLSAQVHWKFLSLDSSRSIDGSHQAKSNEVGSENLYSVSVKALNVRQEPNIKSEIIKTIPQFERVSVWEVRNGWARIDTGWVMLRFLGREK
ncbi:SH3 domain-containing protein [Helicobacter kayseriensis]|uniref:SH3 domain-containing protein n=1 Tax=Helicobacter kayseriensis TaxID=2905877 RepID=UPI001E649E32|nr:SH3 domain-containing protein [Helicobacter kayseriensis]MCE3047041.1 SH3 domain-containing protein [Helicobacter kayseriensis]MCE3048299.1 SH3 domain-containing protein [Helicobacter kayseriensis]